ncbi:RlmE family RNA methyltransferase [Candidatus Liberibacter asiaticus]|uniref:Ribosomal RNA large subunit methyltransferase E n=3 Tax=Liberibacter asiaticus TaxID=34021 RepID=C6XHP3_LIBAP|nr:RlmE family RNA methyltransferase [Candidatus Liberibacter asiaticus]ACT56786.1 ribosomal RNA methyltransferase RrmJ/FtsJ [Candidatus Liberibacter asiaticus str. psy62]AGH16553.1 ribosomal RNA methyltransferase RrmJ/FtsJ [Candidatus Liberibacter asiaticus str. gxpsy]ALK06949.1 23S rRNA methyltransferase [Candidatus Liberibacter asiaticus]ASK52418.1 23S rRNA methyltransferase [Candidatus Liberibacter asiaticus]AWL13744.1 RlmE family RNA methyltransferase [Candidatus Liberibacter asiaticus]
MVKPPGSSSRRGLTQKVKNRSCQGSSRDWLNRHINDPYVQRAQLEGWRARSAYKLLQINEKHQILQSNRRIVDLGSSPGSWSQVAARITGSNANNTRVVAIDILDMEPILGVKFFKFDFLDLDSWEFIRQAIGGNPDLVLSDMAYPTIGHRKIDHLRTMSLCEAATFFALEMLNIGGDFLVKTFQGGTTNDILCLLKKHFQKVIHVKPVASRAESVEMFLLAKGFRK